MSEASVSTGPIICKYCGKPIAGPHIWSHGVPFHIECTNPIASNDQRIADLEKRLSEVTQERDELRKVVEKLPKTKDGVVIVPGMLIFRTDRLESAKAELRADFECFPIRAIGWNMNCRGSEVYSTRAAAEAAQKASE